MGTKSVPLSMLEDVRRQLNVVDDALHWKYTGHGRVSFIEALWQAAISLQRMKCLCQHDYDTGGLGPEDCFATEKTIFPCKSFCLRCKPLVDLRSGWLDEQAKARGGGYAPELAKGRG